jgi:dATP pyrophosphohydrolase
MLNIHQEIPIKSFCIAAYICKIEDMQAKYLLIRRCGKHLNGNWQMVSGRLEKGEKAWQATLREIKEETGLVPEKLYATDKVECFYEHQHNFINLVPVFFAIVATNSEVRLSPTEHDDFKWLTLNEAIEHLSFSNQKENIKFIDVHFVKNEAYEYLKIPFEE